MDALIGLVTGGTGELFGWIAGFAGVFAVALGLYFKGGQSVKRKAKINDLERSLDIVEKADEARKQSASDKRSNNKRLRERGKLRE